MKTSALLASAALGAAFIGLVETSRAQPASAADDRVYQNARVWTGDGFETRDFAVRGAYFIALDDVMPGAQRIDLAGRFITPPLSDAHNHVTGATGLSSRQFTDAGVFYVWNPNTITSADQPDRAAYFARPDTYDVVESMGGVTRPFGHPERLYVETLTQWVYRGWELDDFLGNAFHYARSETEVDSVLDLLLEQGAAFVKTYVLYSETFEQRRDNPDYYGASGIDPELLPYLVQAAHQRGLPVAVHVQTRHDARVAAEAGADMLAHLPAYSIERDPDDLEATRLTRADAEALARAGTRVVPTYSLASSARQRDPDLMDEATADALYEVQAHNLQVLEAAGVTILTGTDGAASVREEIRRWVDVGGLSQGAALGHAFETSAYLFPDRQVGAILPGYEASFLVLETDPMVSLDALGQIERIVKQGYRLDSTVSETRMEGAIR